MPNVPPKGALLLIAGGSVAVAKDLIVEDAGKDACLYIYVYVYIYIR